MVSAFTLALTSVKAGYVLLFLEKSTVPSQGTQKVLADDQLEDIEDIETRVWATALGKGYQGINGYGRAVHPT